MSRRTPADQPTRDRICGTRRMLVAAVPLSVCIITYNEEDNIQGALETVQVGR